MTSALREVVASFGVEFDKEGNLKKGDKHVEGLTDQLAHFGKGLVAAFAVEKVFEFGKEVLETADAVAKQSEALGVSTEELQGWQHAAQLSGSSAEEFTDAFTKFTRNIGQARAGTGPAADALHSLGISFDAIKNKAPIDLLDDVVAGLQGVKDPAKRAAAVVDLFGKSGAKLLPLLNEGPEGIKKLRAEVGELGATFDTAFLENAQEVNDNVDRLKLGMRGLLIQVIGPLLPELVHLSQYLISGAKSFIAITKQTNVANALLLGVAVKTLPMLAGGLSSLGAFALEVVAPFLILEDALTFLSGGDSLIGDGLEKAFGSGTGDMVRKWCENAGADITGTFVGALDLLKLAFADTDEASAKLWQKFEMDTRGVGTAIDSILDKIKLIADAFTDLETLQQGANDFLDLVTSPFDTEEDKAQKVKRREDRAAAKADAALKASGASPEARDVPEHRAAANAYENIANGAGAFGPGVYAPSTATAPAPPKNDYASLFRPTAATAPAGFGSAPGQVTNNVAPVINNNTSITVEGGEDVGNRVGKAINKNAAAGSMRGIKAGLVPTPG